uniref:Uncharacterized protein n=1 Tax=Anguilla anguilla TaxID=7936 RepID=A0A0E9XAK9_ANGAN
MLNNVYTNMITTPICK